MSEKIIFGILLHVHVKVVNTEEVLFIKKLSKSMMLVLNKINTKFSKYGIEFV